MTNRYKVRLTSPSGQIYRQGEVHHEELRYMYALPCVTCIKLALAHTFTFARVHLAWSSSCFTYVCQGGIFITYLLNACLRFPGWDLYDL